LFNTDFLKPRHEDLYRRMMAYLKLNEIKRVIKSGEFIREGQVKNRGRFSRRVAEEVFSETFYNGYKNLMQTPKSE